MSRSRAVRGRMDQGKRGGFQRAKGAWLVAVAADPRLSAADLAVAITLSRYLNSRTGYAWPSHQTIAVDTNRDRATVWRSLKRLEALRWLEVVHARGRRNSNRYKPQLG